MKTRFLPVLLSAILPLAAIAAGDGSLVEVFAKGVGLTQDAAMKAANKAAVEQVVGTMVDASTLAENDDIVEERILTYSTGLIADSKIIGTPKMDANGLVSLKVKATVRKTVLREKLSAAKLVSAELDGQSLWAQAVSAQDNLTRADAMIKEVLGRHIACIVAEPVAGKNGKSPIDYNPRTGEVFANVRVRIDISKYRQFVKEVVSKLGPMAEKRFSYRGSFDADCGHYFFRPQFFEGRLLDTENILVVVTNIRTCDAVAMIFHKNLFSEIEKNCGNKVAIRTSLVDTSGNILSSTDTNLASDVQNFSVVARTDSRPGYPCGILPFCAGNFDYDGQLINAFDWDPWMDRVLIISLGTFSPDELKNAGKLEIKVGHMRNGQFIE